MANSFDPTLIAEIITTKAVTKLQDKLAYLPSFTTDFSNEIISPKRAIVNIPVALSASAVQTNPTNFETGDTGLGNCQVTMDHISKSFSLDASDLESGLRLEHVAEINANVFAKKLHDKVFALLTATNYTVSLSGATLSAFSATDIQTLWGALPGSEKVMVLQDAYFAKFLPVNNFSFDVNKGLNMYGFDRFDHAGDFSAAESKVVGFAANPNAIALASAIPAYSMPVAELLSQSMIELPAIGMTVQFNLWGSTATRKTWGSFDVLFGAGAADKSALKLIKSV